MLDGTATRMERVRGTARVTLGPGGLERLYQAGAAKVMLPRTDRAEPEIVLLNTAGGLTGGDRLSYDLTLGQSATVATQTAERAYASTGSLAEVDLSFTVTDGARLTWLPQETILFDRSALSRRTRIELTGTAEILMCEIVVLGRHAMGEAVDHLTFADRREIRRDGRLIHLESLSPSGAPADWTGPALLQDARVFASLVMTGPDLEHRLTALRPLLDDASVKAAASAFDGRLALRAMATDLFPLKRLMARAITHLTGAPLPRVWQI